MTEPFDLVVAGAGIMGLGCAWEESRRGRKIAVYDPSGDGAQASSAAAGILVTRDARVFLSPFREFYVRSIRMYPEWLETLSAASGRPLSLQRGGDYLVFDLSTPAGKERYRAKLRQLEREHSRDFTVSDRLPRFLEGFCPLEEPKSLHFPGEAFVQNREVVSALREACTRSGVRFLQGEPVRAFVRESGRTRFEFTEGSWSAEQVLIAAGAWSGRVLEGLGLAAPMVPVKGQMVRIPKFHDSGSMVHFNDDLYLVPRGDSLVVGATTEPGVWSEGFDGAGEAFVESHLRRMLPGIARLPLESWAGIRPRTRDRLPWMGWVDQENGWAICAGHYKCGISMAPLAVACISKLLRGEKPSFDLAPFHPWRKQGLARLPPGRGGDDPG